MGPDSATAALYKPEQEKLAIASEDSNELTMSLKVVVSLLVLSLLLSDGLAVDKKRRTRLRILVNELEVRFNLLQNSIGEDAL